MTGVFQQRRTGDSGAAQLMREVGEEIEGRGGLPLKLLQGDHVRVELAQHAEDAFGVPATVATDAPMDIVGGDLE